MQCYDYLPLGEEIAQGVSGRGWCYPSSGVYPWSQTYVQDERGNRALLNISSMADRSAASRNGFAFNLWREASLTQPKRPSRVGDGLSSIRFQRTFLGAATIPGGSTTLKICGYYCILLRSRLRWRPQDCSWSRSYGSFRRECIRKITICLGGRSSPHSVLQSFCLQFLR